MHVIGAMQAKNRIPRKAGKEDREALVQPETESRRFIEAKRAPDDHEENGQGVQKLGSRPQPGKGLGPVRSQVAFLMRDQEIWFGHPRRTVWEGWRRQACTAHRCQRRGDR
jgi:hypothetical protein